MLAKYAIRTKIVAVVAFLLVTITGMGLVTLRNIRAINANTVEIATNWLPSIRVLGELRSGVVMFRSMLREHLLAETLEEKQAMEKRLAEISESNNKIRQEYEPMIASPDEREFFEEWVKYWDGYKKSAAEIMALSRKAAGQIPREAHELNVKAVKELSMPADAALKKDIGLNNQRAHNETKSAAETYAAAFVTIVAILAGAVIIGVGISFYLVRDVSNGIASIVRPMQSLGKGDLGAEVPHQGEKTEIGAIADTCRCSRRR
jgi:methyl-accepting chemotaxis protein